jgi:3-oxoadipate enol-lactonase
MTPITIANLQARLQSGETIAYYRQGEKKAPSDPVIVLLHGYCGSSSYWESVLPHIKGIGKVIVPDLRGHGSSTAPKAEVYEMTDMADDLAMLLEVLGEEQAVIVGHSLGGYVTLAFAEKYASKLRAYGLVHSTALADAEAAKANRDRAAETIKRQGIGTFVEGLVPKLFAPAHAETMGEQVEAAKTIGRGTAPEAAIATAVGMKLRPDRSAVLRDAAVPVLLVAGEEDGVVPPERTLVEQAGPAARRALLENCGHMSMYEQPERIAAELTAWMESI